MNALKKVLGGDFRQFTMVFALLALVIAFDIMSGGRMLTPSNFQNLLSGNAYVLVLAIGMVMVIVIGQIDLSVGSVAGFVVMLMALSAQNWGIPWWMAVLLGLGVGILIGAWQGWWVAKLGIPGFITTLAGMMIFRGGVIWVSKSISVPVPEQLEWFGAGYLPEWGPGFAGHVAAGHGGVPPGSGPRSAQPSQRLHVPMMSRVCRAWRKPLSWATRATQRATEALWTSTVRPHRRHTRWWWAPTSDSAHAR